MNRVVNVFSFWIILFYCVITLAIVYDLSLSSISLKGMPYKVEITAGLSLLLLLFGLIRARRRWEGMKDIRRFSKFTFQRPLNKSLIQSALIITILEALFAIGMLGLCLSMLRLHPEYVVPMMIVLGIIFIETFIFISKLLKGGDAFKIGIGPDVIAYFNREIHLIYYTGLQRVEVHDKSINFQYRDELNILLPIEALRPEDVKDFRDAIVETLGPKNIYIDDAFRALE